MFSGSAHYCYCPNEPERVAQMSIEIIVLVVGVIVSVGAIVVYRQYNRPTGMFALVFGVVFLCSGTYKVIEPHLDNFQQILAILLGAFICLVAAVGAYVVARDEDIGKYKPRHRQRR